MEGLINLENLNTQVRKAILPFCEAMIGLHGDNLKSICLYGSGVGEDFIRRGSNINLLFVMDRIDLPDLKKSLKLIKKGRKKGIVPLLLTRQHMESSTDTFPIEFLEMKDNYVSLYGKDILSGLEVNSKNVRLQCEQQLKGGLIRLCQVYLEAGMKERKISSLLVSSLTSLIPIFRSLLRLKGKPLPLKKREIIGNLEKEFGVKGDSFLKILQMKEGKEIGVSLEKLFSDYLEEIERVCVICDKMEI